MSSPGWYPDPSGQPNSFRYWDGQAWSQQTTDNPYVPPPSAWQQPQQGYGADPAATQMAPQQPTPTTPEQPADQAHGWGAEQQAQQWGTQEPTPEQPGAQAWGEQPTPVMPEQPADQAQGWGAEHQAQQWGEQPGGTDPNQQAPWGQQPDQPTQWGGTAPAAGAAGAAGAGGASGWPADTGQGQWGGQQQWGDSTQQFAATPAAGGGDQWSGGGGQWTPMPGDGGNGGGSKKALWVVLAGVLVIALIIGGIFGAMALMGDDDDDSKADETTSETTEDPSDDPSESPSESPSDPPSESPSASPSETPTDDFDDSDDIPTTPVPEICTSGDPMDRESHPNDGTLYGGGLGLPPVKGYIAPPGPVAEVYTFADDVAALYREVQAGKWMSVLAIGGLDKEDAGSDMAAAAAAVMGCMANSPDFYQNLGTTTEVDSEATTVDGRDAWRLRWNIEVDDPTIDAGGDVAEVVIVDLGEDEYGLFAGVVPLGDQQLIKRMEQAIGSLVVE